MSIPIEKFDQFFSIATSGSRKGRSPYPYQKRIAAQTRWPEVINVPTGAGKTEATVVSWLWKRYCGSSEPRRVVYSLPMRGLVEQTYLRVKSYIDNLSAELGDDFDPPIVEKLLGGDVGDTWIEDPTRTAILIGTQDLLLSRALNRGYAMSRFAWPMTFAWLNDDALWIVDEVQLQGVGVTTTTQLQGLREQFGTYHPTSTIFVSATIDRSWLQSADYDARERLERPGAFVDLNEADREMGTLARILKANKTMRRLDHFAPADVARRIVELHQSGTRTLVVVNRVKRAKDIVEALKRLKVATPVHLLHSRFRPVDREAQVEKCFGSAAALEAIVVATQVVEAGIDTSATTLITDLAPWASIVQRLGRCNRRGDDVEANAYWLDPGASIPKADVAPYDLSELNEARELLISMEGKSVAPADLPTGIPIPRERGATLRRSDLLDLFDTTPDLSGNDVDVSRFIRVGEDFNVFVFWRDDPTDYESPDRTELCPAPKADVKKLLERLAASNHAGDARVEVPAKTSGKRRSYVVAAASTLRIGQSIRLDSRVGCYEPDRGFDLAFSTSVQPVRVSRNLNLTDDQCVSDDRLSGIGARVTLELHSEDAFAEAAKLREILPSHAASHADAIVTAARWHDAGKVHRVFQKVMEQSFERIGEASEGGPWAKSISRSGGSYDRPHFRHELVSALAWVEHCSRDGDFSVVEPDLVAYLIAAHHGRARVTMQSFPGEKLEPRHILGVQQGEAITEAHLGSGVISPAFTVQLDLFDVGGRAGDDGTIVPSWFDRVFTLRDREDVGLFRLAYLEALVRIADWNASKLRANESRLRKAESEEAAGQRVHTEAASI